MIVYTHHSFIDKPPLPAKPERKAKTTPKSKPAPKSKLAISGLALELKRALKNERRRKWYAAHKDEIKIRRLRRLLNGK